MIFFNVSISKMYKLQFFGPADRNRTCIARLGGMCSIR